MRLSLKTLFPWRLPLRLPLFPARLPIAAFLLALFAALTLPARAEGIADQGFGVGAAIGDPLGLSLSLPIGENNALNALIGHEFARDPNVAVLADYVWHEREWIGAPRGKVSVYYGPGARLRFAPRPEIGALVVLGFDYVPENDFLQFFFEFGPGINIIPDTSPHVTVGLGLRYFF